MNVLGRVDIPDAILADLTDEQLNWTPPGTIDSIGVVLVHLLADDDYYIRVLLQAEERLWETDDWGRRLGLVTPPVNDQGWDEIRRTPLTVAPVLHYARAVRAATETYLAGLSAEALDREAYALVRAYLALHRDELAVQDLDRAAFICVKTVEMLTHAAVIDQPEMIAGPRLQAFVDDTTRLVAAYLQGAQPSTPTPGGRPRRPSAAAKARPARSPAGRGTA